MKINEYLQNNYKSDLIKSNNNEGRKSAVELKREDSFESTDKLELSSKALDVNLLVEKAKEGSDINQGRIEKIKEMVDKGEYEVSADKIAEALIRD